VSSAAKPLLVERVDHVPAYCGFIANMPAASTALLPCADASTIPRPAQPHPILRGPSDLHQRLRFLGFERAHEHLRLSSHHYLRAQVFRRTTTAVNPTR